MNKGVFKQRLREARKAAGYTLESLAHEFGVARRTTGEWESPKGDVPKEEATVEELAETLGVDFNYLCGID